MQPQRSNIKQSIVDFLHEVRESGSMNMFEVGPLIERKFCVTKAEGERITLAYVFNTFDVVPDETD